MNATGKTAVAVPGHRWKILAALSTKRGHKSIKYHFIYIYITRTHRYFSPDLVRREIRNSILNTAGNEREDGVVFAFEARDVVFVFKGRRNTIPNKSALSDALHLRKGGERHVYARNQPIS